MREPSKKAIDNALRQSTFDPRKAGPMRAITQSSSIPYLVERAIEYLRESPTSDNIRMAISLLALVRVHQQIQGTTQSITKPISRFDPTTKEDKQ